MRIGLLTSHRGQKQFEKEYSTIIHYLEKKGHDVIHSMATTLEQLTPLSYAEREAIFVKFYQELEECELIIAECSVQSIQLGFGISYLRSKGKPIVVLTLKNGDPSITPKGTVYSNIENMMAYDYTSENITEVVDEALAYMEPHMDKRFTIIFPAHLFAKLEEIAQKKKLPKAVYIRQLIEEDLGNPTQD